MTSVSSMHPIYQIYGCMQDSRRGWIVNLAGDAKTRVQTLTQLFSCAASEALPSALAEQEAVAFSASLKRYAQSRTSASETRGLGVAAAQVATAADVDEVDADAATLLDAVDTQFQRRTWAFAASFARAGSCSIA
jgi:hypothetical protein